ncbi:MAG: MBL fold metallo-hydrolase [Candidatus Competibacterales bacterium]
MTGSIIDRRQFLTAATAVAAAGLTSTLTWRRADAQQGPAGGDLTQVAGVQRLAVGDVIVTALLDGYLDLGPQVLIGIDPEAVDERLQAAFAQPGSMRATVSAYAIHSGDRTVLVDAGTADLFGPTVGRLAANLQAAGIDPGSVDQLVVTHLHPDHVGGVAADNAIALPNAELVVHRQEVDFWGDKGRFSDAPEQMQTFAQVARNAVARFEGRTRLLEGEGETEIASGLTAVPLPGHTPGHMGVRVTSGDRALLIWGDIIHAPAVQFPQPEVSIVFDIDPEQAAATRQRLLEQVAVDRTMVAGMHLSFPGFGHVVSAQEGYRFEPTPWQHEL